MPVSQSPGSPNARENGDEIADHWSRRRANGGTWRKVRSARRRHWMLAGSRSFMMSRRSSSGRSRSWRSMVSGCGVGMSDFDNR